MSTWRMWAVWRRVQYGALFLTLVFLVSVASYGIFMYAPATCFDGIQNGQERAVDCDGSCVRICSVSVQAPNIVWAKSFKIQEGQYNAVGYVENKNEVASTPALSYTFKLSDAEGVIVERSGTTILPPNSVYPIFEGRIVIENGREPTETTLVIAPIELWLPATVGRSQFKTLDVELLNTDTRPRLNVEIENTELTEARNVEVVATIFNREGTPLTSSQTFIDLLPARGTKEVVFTWPNSIAKTVRSCEVPSDIMLVLDRSGSMAADGGDPPEPLTSAKAAAKSFLRLVRETDLVGLVSYATVPSSPIEQTLTADKTAAEQALESIVMGEDGVQYTNMGEAFNVAFLELMSERHRPDARKVIVFLTDGDVTRPLNPETGVADREYAATFARMAAAKALAENVTVYTIGFGDLFASEGSDIDRDSNLIKDLASDPTQYYTAPTVAELKAVYQKIANDLCEEGPTKIEVITKTSTNFVPLR
jgi:Mg-chelatase subunit ChlD